MFEERNIAELARPAPIPGELADAGRPIVLTAKVDASHQVATGVTGIGRARRPELYRI
jgi:hypothetical protein